MNVTSSSPLKEQVRAARLDLSILNEYVMNGQQSLASTQIGSIITNLQGLQTSINAATNQSITRL